MQPSGGPQGPRQQRNLYYLLLGLLDPLLLVFLDLDVQALAMHFKMRSISCDFAYEESYLEIFPRRENSENPRDS